MSQPPPALAATSSPAPPETRLRGRWLRLARIGWGLGVLVETTVFLFSVPALFALVHQPCSARAARGCMPAELSPADFQKLGGPGPAINAYAVYVLVTVLASTLVGVAVGGLIAWRKWRDPMGLFVSFVLIADASSSVIFGATPTWNPATGSVHVPEVLARSGPVISFLGIAVTELLYPALAIFLLTFPTGRFAPRWSALLVLPWVVQNVLFFVSAPFAVIEICLLANVGGAAALQVYRYARLSTPVQRQQTKWAVFSLAFVAVPLFIAYYVAPVFWPALNTPGSVYRLASIAVLLVGWMPLSLGIAIAILRHRLYDIDLIIRRTLIYGTLTAILAALYFGVVIGLQALVGRVSSAASHSPVIIVASTLLIAALFDPVRRRIQSTIDRRFYRRKYDAARTLATFGATLRSEVDLSQLTEHLVIVVQETMQPAHVSLWLVAPRRAPNQRSGEPPLRRDTRGQEP